MPARPEPPRRAVAGTAAVAAALERGAPLRLVLVRARAAHAPSAALEALAKRLAEAGVRMRRVGEREWERTAADPSADVLGMLGPPPRATLEETLRRPGAVWLLVGTAYPGNAGFVVRTAEVSGAAGAVVDAAFERPERREALRAAMRVDRYMPVHFESAARAVREARTTARRVVAVETTGACAPWETDLRGAVLFVVGGEARGIPEWILGEADAVVRLPMAGFLRSYNVQAAVAAVAAERLRQEATAE